MATLIDQGVLTGGDGRFHPEQEERDRLCAPGHDVDHRLTESGAQALRDLGSTSTRSVVGGGP